MLLVFSEKNRLEEGWLFRLLLPSMLFAMFAAPLRGQVRLLGITVDTTNSVSLVEIDAADGSHEFLAPLTSVNQRHALAYHPESGLAYHAAGGNSLHSLPDHEPEELGFRDTHFLETVRLDDFGRNAIFNANGPPSIDRYDASGLPAVRPAWVFPELVRIVDQTDVAFQERGVDEYQSLDSLAWIYEHDFFLGADRDAGLYTMDTDGLVSLVAEANYDLVAHHRLSQDTNQLIAVSNVQNVDAQHEVWLSRLDIESFEVAANPVALLPPSNLDQEARFGQLLSAVQHPQNGEFYGVRLVDPNDGVINVSQLISFDPMTGESQFIGELTAQVTDLMFVTTELPVGACDLTGDGVCDATDLDANAVLIQQGLATQESRIQLVARPRPDGFGTWFGDANLDGRFDTADLVQVFRNGIYERVGVSATWVSGDWSGDSLFDSADLIIAFQDGGYENGIRQAAAVPEPQGCGWAGLLVPVLFLRRRVAFALT